MGGVTIGGRIGGEMLSETRAKEAAAEEESMAAAEVELLGLSPSEPARLSSGHDRDRRHRSMPSDGS